jgi:hypothetical protein
MSDIACLRHDSDFAVFWPSSRSKLDKSGAAGTLVLDYAVTFPGRTAAGIFICYEFARVH